MEGSRITSYDDTVTLYNNLKKEDEGRAQARARVEGQISGNLPYNPEELKAKGQGYRANVNFRELESSVKIRTGSFVRLFFDTTVLVRVELNDYEIPVNYRLHFASIIAEEFHRMLRAIPGFFTWFALAMRNMVVHGFGVLYWPTEKEFIPKAAIPGKVLFSNATAEDPEDFDVVMIEDEISWERLFSLIQSRDHTVASSVRGWNLKNVMALLEAIRKKDGTDSFSRIPETPEEYEQLRARKAVFAIESGKPRSIEIVQVYAKEETGKISKYIFVRDDALVESFPDPEDQYLYRKTEEFESFDDLAIPLQNEIGNDGIHSVRGYGHRIYPNSVIGNRMMNTAIDGAMLSSTIVVQSPVNGQTSVSDVLRIGAITVLDDSHKVVTGNFGVNVQPVVQMKAILDANSANSWGTARPQQEGGVPGAAYKTARQTDYEMVRNNSLTNVEVTIFYLFVDRVYETIRKKMKNPKLSAKNKTRIDEFIDRCVKRGVPEEIASGFDWRITATRAVGNGSLEMQLGMTRDGLALASALPEDGKRAMYRDFLSARFGVENVDRYYPMLDQDQITHFSHQLAGLETNDMMLGQAIVVSPDDDHVYHLTQHLNSTQQAIQLFMEQKSEMEADEMVRFIERVITHISEHLSMLPGEQNKQIVTNVMTELQKLKVFHKQLQNVAAQQEAQEQQAEQQKQQILESAAKALEGTELQLQLTKIARDHELKLVKEQNNDRVRTMKTLNGIRLAEEMTSAKVRNMERESQAKVAGETL